MATLMIRDLDDAVKARLRVQAAEHGRSMEAEARILLASALSARRPNRGLGSYIRDEFAVGGGAVEGGAVELEIAPRNDAARVADLSE